VVLKYGESLFFEENGKTKTTAMQKYFCKKSW
jgi:hypothetical protein